MFCPACGAKVEEGCKFCTRCGHSVAQIKPRNNSKTVEKPVSKAEKREVTFRVSPNLGIVYIASIVGLVIAVILCFYEHSQLSGFLKSDYYAEERLILFVCGIVCAVLAVEILLMWRASAKIKLTVGARSVSGIRMINGCMTREFEFGYDEISEVKIMLGSLLLRADGKWVGFGNLENRKKAQALIEERIKENI